MISCEFYKPTDLKETCELLSQHGEKATIIAGGTDVMVAINRKKLLPQIIIAVNDIGLNEIKVENNQLIIGATTTYTEICQSQLVLEHTPLLLKACSEVGSRAIRNMGTIGGNLVNASRVADSAVALLALEAKLKLVTSTEERIVSIDSFFLDDRKTIKKPTEFLKEIIIPLRNQLSKWGWHKIGQRKADFISIVSVALVLQIENQTCNKARIAMGSVAPTPLFLKKVSQMLEGQHLDNPLIDKIIKTAVNEIQPFDDRRATAWYRKKVSGAILKRLLIQISQPQEIS